MTSEPTDTTRLVAALRDGAAVLAVSERSGQLATVSIADLRRRRPWIRRAARTSATSRADELIRSARDALSHAEGDLTVAARMVTGAPRALSDLTWAKIRIDIARDALAEALADLAEADHLLTNAWHSLAQPTRAPIATLRRAALAATRHAATADPLCATLIEATDPPPD